jgi:hypothetical protein
MAFHAVERNSSPVKMLSGALGDILARSNQFQRGRRHFGAVAMISGRGLAQQLTQGQRKSPWRGSDLWQTREP